MKWSDSIALLVLSAASTHAQGFGGYYGGDGSSNNPYSNGDNGDGNSGFSDFGGFGDFSQYSTKLIAHAVLATLAFGFFFPVGGIMIRLASFRGLWWIHGLFQLFAYILYIAAFALGVWMVSHSPERLLNHYHPIIGIVLLVLIFFQPILGFLHHLMFKKYSRRTFWSYSHLWLGRIIITLGIINGGLGLMFAKQFPLAPPTNGQIIGYAVAAGFMWLLYVFSVIIGERRRSAVREVAPPAYKEASEAGSKHSRQEYA